MEDNNMDIHLEDKNILVSLLLRVLQNTKDKDFVQLSYKEVINNYKKYEVIIYKNISEDDVTLELIKIKK